MKPVDFPEKTKILRRPPQMSEEQCAPLPVFMDKQSNSVISCWEPSWKERLSILFYGRIWVWVMSGYTQPPIALEGKKTIFKITK